MTQLNLRTKAISAITRRLPVNIRRVRLWRDQIYSSVGAGGWEEDDELDATWPSVQNPVKHRVSGMRMALDLTDWMERRSYFTGRFYQEDLEDLLSSILRPGDNFVDVGANVGLVTLHAASLVGACGAVRSFEPNPKTFARLSHNIKINDLTQCRATNSGLGADKQTLQLNLYGRHSGKATLVGRSGEGHETIAVQIARGEDELADLDTSKPTVIKIDVEGYEVTALRGLHKLLGENVAVVAEVSPKWLELAGTSASEMLELLTSYGLQPHKFEICEFRYGRDLTVLSMEGQFPNDQFDCLFMRPHSVFAHRLTKTIK